MMSAERCRIYVHLSSLPDCIRVAAVGAEDEGRTFEWPPTAGAGEVDERLHELLAYLPTADIFVHDRQPLDDLLSRPGLPPGAQTAMQRTRDLLPAALIILPAETDYALPALAERLGLPPQPDQDPLGGAELCRAVAGELVARLEGLSAPLLLLLGRLIGGDPAFDWLPWDDLGVGQGHPRSAGGTGAKPTYAQPQVADGALEMLVSGMRKAPPQRARKKLDLQQPLDQLSVAMLEPDNVIARALESYEHRPGQIQMAEAVARSLENDEFLLAEAGTGVGKSLAYLIPAILWARANAEPVLVSTNTKNLQEQLIGQDLPLLARALPVDFEAALLKGRGNYLCVRRFVTLVREASGSLFPDERAAAAYLAAWASAAETGDLDSLLPEAEQAFEPLSAMIERVRSDRTTCPGPTCPHARLCPLRVARATARNADLVVSNHALTLADPDSDVLPLCSRIIFDEAHNLEAVATDQLGREVSTFSFAGLRRTFGAEGGRGGLVDALAEELERGDRPGAAHCRELAERLANALRLLLEAGDDLGEEVISFCFALDSEAGGAPPRRRAGQSWTTGRATVRLNPEVWQSPQGASAGARIHRCRQLLDSCQELLAQLAESLAEMGERGEKPALDDLALEAAGARASLAEVNDDLGAVLAEQDAEAPQHVCWAETWRSDWGPCWRLCAAPIRIGPVLEQAVYDKRAALVLTSATLTVDGTFDYLRHRLGLNEHEERIVEQTVSSPFSLEQQLLLCVPQDLPISGEQGSADAIQEALVRIASLSGGGVLALFTARQRMIHAYEQTRDRLAELGLNPLCQGLSGPRWALLRQLRESEDTVLYGLKSFWEGVDVPGRSLRCVVIVKLPFAVPTDPIIEARCEQMEREGLDSRQHYYIPEAIIGFKQGFGRLIRATTDLGVVFALDNRLLVRGYGRRFFRSLQRCSYHTGSLEECLEEAQMWLRRA